MTSVILVDDFPQHGAIRTTLSGLEDYENDDAVGFHRIEAREIDTLGAYCLMPTPDPRSDDFLQVSTAL